MLFKTEEEVAEWLKKQKEEDEKNMEKPRKISSGGGYIIQSDEEWKEILKYHNVPYYPRFETKQAEETYQSIRSYFDNNNNNNKKDRPSFCSVPTKVAKLEKRLDALNKILLLTEGLTKKEENEIRQKIMWIEKKLYIRR